MSPSSSEVPECLSRDLKLALADSFDIDWVGKDLYGIYSPFTYSDGDNLALLVSRQGDRWSLTDRGQTTSHLFFDDFEFEEDDVGHKSIERIVNHHHAELTGDFEIIMRLDAAPTPFDVADFIQMLSQVQTVALLAEVIATPHGDSTTTLG